MESKASERKIFDDQDQGPSLQLQSCLFCLSPAKANSFETFHSLPGCEGSELLNQQMWSTFILRNLLEYPDQNFSTLMEASPLVNPGSWFDMCDNCASIVKSAMEIYSNILRLTSELSHLKNRLENVMKISEKNGNVHDLSSVNSHCETIRKYFKDKSSTRHCQSQSNTIILKVEHTDKTPLELSSDFAVSQDDHDASSSNELTDDDNECCVEVDNFDNEDEDIGCTGKSNDKLKFKEHSRKQRRNHREGDAEEEIIHPRKKHTRKDAGLAVDKCEKDGTYSCPSCPVTSRNRRSMLQHLRQHRRNKYIFKCKTCQFPATTFQQLRSHMQRMHSSSNQNQNEVNNDNDHSTTGGDSGMIDLDFQDESLMAMLNENQSSYESSDEEEQAKSFTCQICRRAFTLRRTFQKHKKLHTKFKQFECPKCKFPSISQDALDRHLNRKMCKRFQVKVYKCDQCEFSSYKKYKLDAHVSMHKANAVETDFPCEICERTFSTEGALKMHAKCHEIRKKKDHKCKDDIHFECELCPHSTTTKQLFEKHMTSHKIFDGTQTADGRWKCNLCDDDAQVIFSFKRQLGFHKREVHGAQIGLTLFKCSQCPNVYARKDTLDHHFNQIHQNKLKFFCEFCGYGTNKRSSMTAHRASRHGSQERSHVCERCGMSYKSSNGLITHMRRIHSGTGNQDATATVKCKYCEKELSNKALLNLHFRNSHGDLYAHKCDECDNSYMSVGSLQLHKKINHTEGNAECQFCGAKVTSSAYLYSHFKKVCKMKPPGFKFSIPRRGKSNSVSKTN